MRTLPLSYTGSFTGSWRQHFMAYVVDADIPAPLGEEALETLGGHLNFCERVLTLESLGADIPLEMSPAGALTENSENRPRARKKLVPGPFFPGRGPFFSGPWPGKKLVLGPIRD